MDLWGSFVGRADMYMKDGRQTFFLACFNRKSE